MKRKSVEEKEETEGKEERINEDVEENVKDENDASEAKKRRISEHEDDRDV